MAIVGFGFTKMLVEKKKQLSQKINIRNNIAIKNIEEHEFQDLGDKKQGLKFAFEFISNYDPDAAEIRLLGEVFFIGEKAQCEDILKGWKKDKNVPKGVMPNILNYALSRCNVQAICLSKDASLPPPLPMPKLNNEKTDNSYIG